MTMSQQPVVSVCIPTYNRRDYLRLAIDSVLSQPFDQPYEIVIVDDGSTDDTAAMIRQLNEPRIRYVYQSNAGDAAARNRLIELAAGEYITFLDSDDLMAAGALAAMYHTIRQYDQPTVVYGGYWRIDENGKITGRCKRKLPSGFVTEKLFQSIFIHSCGAMFPRSIFQQTGLRFDTSLKVCSDYKLWLTLSTQYRFVALPQPTFLRRRHSGCLSTVSSDKLKIELQVLQEFYDTLGKKYIREKIARKRFAHCWYRIGKALISEGRSEEAYECFLNSFRNKATVKNTIKLLWGLHL